MRNLICYDRIKVKILRQVVESCKNAWKRSTCLLISENFMRYRGQPFIEVLDQRFRGDVSLGIAFQSNILQ